MRLTWKEIQFLTECCYFNYNGGDLNNFTDLSDHFIKIKFFNTKSDCSVYKTKLSNKRWIKSGRDFFKLPPQLDIKDDKELHFNISLEYKPDVVG